MELLEEVWPLSYMPVLPFRGLVRGALVAANRIKPDIGIVLEGTTCADVPKVKEHEVSTVMGEIGVKFCRQNIHS